MVITEYIHDEVIVLVLDGRLSGEGADKLEAALRYYCVDNPHKVVLDMRNVDYINSTGLRLLAECLGRGKVRIVGLTANVERAMRLVGFHQVVQPYETLQAALVNF